METITIIVTSSVVFIISVLILKKNGILIKSIKHKNIEIELETCKLNKKNTEKNIIFNYSTEAKNDLRDIEVNKVEIYLEKEFHSHPRLLENDFDDFIIPYHNFKILLSYKKNIIIINRIFEGTENSIFNYWFDLLRQYRQSTILPYRVNNKTLSNKDIEYSIKKISILGEKAVGYLERYDLSTIEKENIKTHINSLGQKDYYYVEKLLIVEMEMIISLTHKILMKYIPITTFDRGIKTLSKDSIYASNKKNIIVVEDEYTNRKIMEIDLKKAGFKNIYSFSDPTELLGFSINNKIDILITDIYMPNIDGITLVNKMKKLNSKMKTIIISSHNEENFDQFKDDNLVRFYSKPLRIPIKNIIQQIEKE